MAYDPTTGYDDGQPPPPSGSGFTPPPPPPAGMFPPFAGGFPPPPPPPDFFFSDQPTESTSAYVGAPGPLPAEPAYVAGWDESIAETTPEPPLAPTPPPTPEPTYAAAATPFVEPIAPIVEETHDPMSKTSREEPSQSYVEEAADMVIEEKTPSLVEEKVEAIIEEETPPRALDALPFEEIAEAEIPLDVVKAAAPIVATAATSLHSHITPHARPSDDDDLDPEPHAKKRDEKKETRDEGVGANGHSPIDEHDHPTHHTEPTHTEKDTHAATPHHDEHHSNNTHATSHDDENDAHHTDTHSTKDHTAHSSDEHAHTDTHGHDDHDEHGHGHHHPASAYIPEHLVTLLIQIPHHCHYDVPTFAACLGELCRQASKTDTHLTLEIASIHQKTGFYVTIFREYREKFEAVIYAYFNDVDILEAEHFPPYLGEHTEVAGEEILTEHPYYFPLKNYDADFQENSLLYVMSAFSIMALEDFGCFQIVLNPMDVNHWEKKRFRMKTKIAAMLDFKHKFYEKDWQANAHDRMFRRVGQERVHARMMAYFESSIPGKAARCLDMFNTNFKAYRVRYLNDLIFKPIKDREELQKKFFGRPHPGKKMILAHEEILMFYHLPPASIHLANLDCLHARKAEPPHGLATGDEMDTLPFAHTTFRNRFIDFGLMTADRRRHLYLLGKSGSGKSKMLELLIRSDMQSGHGLAVIDPHGDLADEILNFVPKERIKDVLYFNVQDDDHPIAFNLLANITEESKHIIIHGFISIFQKLFSALWLPGMEHVLRYALLAVLDLPEPTINDVQRILTDKAFRAELIPQIKEPSIRNFWANEFLQLQEKQGHRTVTPLINKLGEFTLNPLIQRIVGQKKCNIKFDEILNGKKILIANLAKGKIGENNCALLGSMLVTKIQETAMARVNIPEDERKDFFFYIDEFQNFASNAFNVILSEARKFRLNLIIAHQYLNQLSPDVRNAVFGNVGSIATFRVGPEDATFMAQEFTPTFTAEDVINLSVRDIYLRLSLHGHTSTPFSARTLDIAPNAKESNREAIIAWSREHYANTREAVERELFGGEEKEDTKELVTFRVPMPLAPAV